MRKRVNDYAAGVVTPEQARERRRLSDSGRARSSTDEVSLLIDGIMRGSTGTPNAVDV
jgi:hypothetical protein